MKKKRKKKCASESPLCSGQLIRSYYVGNDKTEKFDICGPCAVYIRRTVKLKEAR